MDFDFGLEDESTLAKKLHLDTKIRATKQGNRSIQELYDVMVSLWNQMARLESHDLIKSRSYRKFQEENHLIQFLLALRDEFEPFKSSLLSRYLVPSLPEVVRELKTEEARLRSSSGYLNGKFEVEDSDGPVSKFSSLSMKTDENHEPAPSGGIAGEEEKIAAASLAVAGVSRSLSDYFGGSEEYHSGQDSSTLKILTYNVCLWDVEQQERMKAVGRLIELHTPDIICFQEVTSDIYSIFKQSRWWNAYNCSVSLEDTSDLRHFCIQLSRLPVKSFSRLPFRNSRMGRELCVADIEVCRGKSLIVATSHLESRNINPLTLEMYSEERVAQAKEAFDFLPSSGNVIFCGDMNWDDEADGRFPLPQGWIDAWKELRPWLKGWTCDTNSNPMLIANRPLQVRLDRFLSKLDDFKLKKISMIGTEAIHGVSYLKEKRVRNRVQTLELPVLPSDHYGLMLEIHSE